ncbi:MAG: hypothetical protein WAN20_19980, partial [Pseudonocardiaceae bacterium]
VRGNAGRPGPLVNEISAAEQQADVTPVVVAVTVTVLVVIAAAVQHLQGLQVEKHHFFHLPP